MSAATCYACGSPDLAEGADLRNPTCVRCLPCRDHVVSNQTGADGRKLAICQCGWRDELWTERGRDRTVKAHWAAVVEAAACAA